MQRSAGAQFLDFVLQHSAELDVSWPIRAYADKQSNAGVSYANLHELLVPLKIEYNASHHLMLEHLKPPFVFGKTEGHLRHVVQYYLQFFCSKSRLSTRRRPSVEHNYCVVMLSDDAEHDPWTARSAASSQAKVYYLSGVEKALLFVLTCFAGDYFLTLRPGVRTVLQFPGSLRNWLLLCSLSSMNMRCTFMPRWSSDESTRQLIWSNTLDFDDFEYRQRNGQLKGAPVDADPQAAGRLYFLVQANEILHELGVRDAKRIGCLRFMFDNYSTGSKPGLKDDEKPTYYVKRSQTLVGLMLSTPEAAHRNIRIMQRTSDINHYLATDEATYSTERKSQYPRLVNALLKQVPTQSTLASSVDDLFARTASEHGSRASIENALSEPLALQAYDCDWLHASQVLSLLANAWDFKLVTQMQMFLKLDDYDAYACCLFQQQVAIRVQAFYCHWCRILSWRLDRHRQWIADIHYSKPGCGELATLLAIPRWQLLVMQYCSSALRLHRQSQQVDNFAWSSPPFALSAVLASLVNPNRSSLPSTVAACFDGRSMTSVIMYLYCLLIGDVATESKLSILQKHAVKVERLVHYLCTQQFTQANVRDVVVNFFHRTIIVGTDNGCVFGDLGQLLLVWMLLPVLELRMSFTSQRVMQQMLQGGLGMRETTAAVAQGSSAHHQSVRNDLALQTADALRQDAMPPTMWFTNNTDDEITGDWIMLTDADTNQALRFVESLIDQCDAYHPDCVFAIMSMFCARLPVTREYFHHFFPRLGTPAPLSMQGLVTPVDAKHLHLGQYPALHSDLNLTLAQRSHDLNCQTLMAMVGGLSDSHKARDLSNHLNASALGQHYMAKAFVDDKPLHSSVVLPFYTHPGEVVTPIMTSLLMQVAQEETASDRRRLDVDKCKLVQVPLASPKQARSKRTCLDLYSPTAGSISSASPRSPHAAAASESSESETYEDLVARLPPKPSVEHYAPTSPIYQRL